MKFSKKTACNKLAAKVNNIDTSGFSIYLVLAVYLLILH